MITERISISQILPTIWRVSTKYLHPLCSQFAAEEFNPIPSIKDEENFIIGGGHHRSALFYLASIAGDFSITDKIIPSYVCESDEDVRKYFEGNFKNAQYDYMLRTFSSRCRKFTQRNLPSRIEDLGLEIEEKFRTIVLNSLRELTVKDREVYSSDEKIHMLSLPPKDKILSALSI